MTSTSLTITIGPEQGLQRYLAEIRKFPMLAKDEEYMLAKRWREHEDPVAAEKLVTSHLRLVAKMAMGYRGYGLPIGEVISEGNIGLMQAVKKFEPEKGFRLATYAMWWIRASIQEYVLRTWSLVKIGTTAAQKKLFFNLRRMKQKMQMIEEGELRPDQIEEISTKLGVEGKEVVNMNRRLSGPDASLNVQIGSEEGGQEWQDWLATDEESQETVLGQNEEYDARMVLLNKAMANLNEREQKIIQMRRLREEPLTLEELADEFGVSRERIRQIEVRAFEKLQEEMKKLAQDAGLLEAAE